MFSGETRQSDMYATALGICFWLGDSFVNRRTNRYANAKASSAPKRQDSRAAAKDSVIDRGVGETVAQPAPAQQEMNS